MRLPASSGLRDVVDAEHEPRDGALPRVARPPVLGIRRGARAPEDGRDVHAQELSARGGDEARDGGGVPFSRRAWIVSSACATRLRSRIANTDRPSPTRPAPATADLAARGVAEELPRLAVVEEDAPLEVADEHRLRRLGDDGGEPVALLVHLLLRVRYPRLDLAPQGLVLVGERVDRAGELPHLRSAHRLEPV